jgi:hypothetical protein
MTQKKTQQDCGADGELEAVGGVATDVMTDGHLAIITPLFFAYTR